MQLVRRYIVVLLFVSLNGFTFEVKQVGFNADWLVNTNTVEYSDTHVAGAGQLLVLDFELTTSTDRAIKTIAVSFTDNEQIANQWRYQLRVGDWGYQKAVHLPQQLQLNANRLYPVKLIKQVNATVKRPLRINLLVWTDNSLTAVNANGQLTVVDDKGLSIQAFFSINKLPIALGLLDAPIGVYEYYYDYGRRANPEQLQAQQAYGQPFELYQQCVALFAQQLGLEHRKVKARRHRLVEIEELEARYQQTFDSFFGSFPYQQTDLVHRDELKRLYHSLIARQFGYVNQQLQLFYQHNLWLPDLVANEYLSLFNYKNSLGFSDLRSVLDREENHDHPMANALLFGDKSKAVKDYFVGMLSKPLPINAETIALLHHQGKQPWFLHLSDKRAGAGWFVWRSGANGYMQWQPRLNLSQFKAQHSSFDQGERLYDFAFHYPSKLSGSEPCQDDGGHLVIDSQWLALAVGVMDRRWILWLQQLAHQKGPMRETAQQLLATITEQVPDDWSTFIALIESDAQQMQRWRHLIVAYARQIHSQ